mgnify:CR=1 FL=1
MIRKLYTILLIGLCLNLVACGDDNEKHRSKCICSCYQIPDGTIGCRSE